MHRAARVSKRVVNDSALRSRVRTVGVQHAGMKALVSMLVFLVACGSHSSGADGSGGDDAPKVFMDAPAMVPQMITISGTASEQAQSGATPLAGVTIGIYRTSDESTALATAMTDAQGKYSVMVPTGGHDVDGFIKATKSGYVDTYAYPASPWIASSTLGDANMLSTSTFGLLVSFGGGHSGNGVITMIVTDTSNMPVMGATVTTSPASGAYKYSDSSGFPTSTTATAADGLSFMFDVPPGNVTVNAMKPGMQFHAHALNARADKFTTTVIEP